MKWFYQLSKAAQISLAVAFPFSGAAFLIIYACFPASGPFVLILGTLLFAIGIFFIYHYSKAENQRREKQVSEHPKTRDPDIHVNDSNKSIIDLAHKRARKLTQTGDIVAIQARLKELNSLILSEAEREKYNTPADIPALQRQVALLYEQEALLQYMTGISQHSAPPPTPSSSSNATYFTTVTIIDFETATDSLTSICAIGLCFIRGGQIVGSEHYYVQPPENRYDAENISIHGITPDITKNADPFPVVWEKIKHYFQNTYIAAHNAKRFDMPALKATMEQFGIEQPQFEFIDTMYICDEFKDPKCRRSLDALCSSFSIQLDRHHDPEADAVAAAKLIIYAFEHSKFRAFNVWLKHHVETFSFCDVSPRYTFSTTTKHPKIDVHEIAVTTEVNDEKDDDFNGKTFLFTGTLQHFSREEAMRKVVERGGIIKNGISNKVDVLVNANPDGVTTSKVEKAIAMQAAGHRIKIINEEQFLKMLESNNAIQI